MIMNVFSSNQAGAGFLDGWFQAIIVSEPAPTLPGILPVSQELKTYILSNTLIPNNSKPNFKVLAVKSHKINREVRNGSSDFNT